MTTKFVSKNSNYMLVLKPGVEGNRALGTHAVAGLYVKFQSGTLDINDESIISMLRAHPSYGTDFLEIKQDEIDPYIDNREDSEPGHIIQEIKYGHAEKAVGTPIKSKLTPQLKKVIEKEALKMIPGLLKSNPKILKDIILSLAADMQAKDIKEPVEVTGESSETETPKRGPGRPPSVKEE